MQLRLTLSRIVRNKVLANVYAVFKEQRGFVLSLPISEKMAIGRKKSKILENFFDVININFFRNNLFDFFKTTLESRTLEAQLLNGFPLR